MATVINVTNGLHIQNQLTRSLERILEDANLSGELKLSNRKLKDFPKASSKYNLSDTVIADLSKNRLSELPEEVTNFLFLERLQCYHNSIRNIPDSIGSLQCLNYLDLSRNQLSVLPREICQLPIQILLISNNKLTCLPDELGRMLHLTELDASCNQITHLPPRLADLRSLQSLVLRNNLLLCVPLELTYLKLVRLDLRANRIGNLPIELREMDSLIELLVDDNPLTSPPASLCKRGRVHIFKYLDTEAIKLDRKAGIHSTGTLGRHNIISSSNKPRISHFTDKLKKRQNVDSGYSTSSDIDKRWSQDLTDSDKVWSTPIATRIEYNGTPTNRSNTSTPTTMSSGDLTLEDDKLTEAERKDDTRSKENSGHCMDLNHAINTNGIDEKKPLQQIQTYREYKEALKQQRAQDVPAIYRTKDSDDSTFKTEPNTPTRHSSPAHSTMATSKSDPTPLNSALSSPRHIFEDIPKRPIQKVQPCRNGNSSSPNHLIYNGSSNLENRNGSQESNRNGSLETNRNGNVKYIQDYIKPKSPSKSSSGILSHDYVPPSSPYSNGRPASPRTNSINGVKSNRNAGWTKETVADKMSFTMRREIDKAKEETELINQLRNIIETRLKMALPEDLAPALTDGVVLCHLANHIKPRSVGSIHVPSPAVPKLTMARCRRNVDNFIEACRRIGVDEELLCSSVDVTEGLYGRGLSRLLDTLRALCEHETSKELPQQHRGLHDTTVSLLLLAFFVATVILLIVFPPPE